MNKLVLLLCFILVVTSTQALVIEQPTQDGGTGRRVGFNTGGVLLSTGQTFNYSQNIDAPPTEFRFDTLFCEAGGCITNVTLRIEHTTNNLPNGTIVASTYIGTLQANTSYVVNFTTIYENLQPYTNYAIVFNTTASPISSRNTHIATNATANYVDGSLLNFQGAPWTNVSGDMKFYLLIGSQPHGLYITAREIETANLLTNFNFTLENGSIYNSGDNSTLYINISDGTYTGTVSKQSYIPITQNFEVINDSFYILYFTPSTNINFTFFDEQTNEPILNISYLLYNPQTGYSIEANTTTGSIGDSVLSDGLYTLEYSSEGYRLRRYFFYIPLNAVNLSNSRLYLLNESEGDSYLPNILNENDDPYTGVFQALRWYSVGDGTGEYRLVESSQVDSQGLAAMFLEFNTASYIFRAKNLITNEIDASYYVPKQLFLQSETYRVIFQEGLFGTFQELEDMQGTPIQYFNTTTEYYQYSYSSKPSSIYNICLQVSTTFGINHTVTTVCSVSTDASLLYVFNSTQNPGYYHAAAFANTTEGVTYLLAQRQDNFLSRDQFPQTELYKNIGILAAFFLALTGAFMVPQLPAIGIFFMIGGVGLIGTLVLNIVPFGSLIFIGICIIGFLVAVITKK